MHRVSGGKRVAGLIICYSAIAVVVSVMICTLTGQPFLMVLTCSFVYTSVIGSLGHAILTWTWYRLARSPAPVVWVAHFGLLLVTGTAGTLLSVLILTGIGLYPTSAYWREIAVNIRFVLLITLVLGTAFPLYEILRDRLDETRLALRTRELEKERALKLATEARLASLESRIHPHFLFNALNSISALIRRDPDRAESLVERMAALLRFSLDARQIGLTPLSREMKIVKDYLEIERARFGARLRYAIDVPAELADLEVPPLAVQTLVENSVKYVVSQSLSGGEIAIRASQKGDILHIEVADSGPGFDPEAAPSGHGIDNVRERLANLFGDRASLTAGHDGKVAWVRITVPQTAPAREPVRA